MKGVDGGRRNGLPWHAGLAPLTVEVEWPDGCHRITWRAGKVILDHHRDLAGEEVYIALGGERCPCLDVLEAWRSWQAEPAMLMRWANEHPAPPPMAFRSAGGGGSFPSVAPARDVLRELRSRFQAVQRQLQRAPGPVTVAGGASVAFGVARSTVPTHRQPPPPSPRQRQQMLASHAEQHRQLWRDVLFWALPDGLRDRLALGSIVRAARRRPQEWHRWKRAVEAATSSRAVPALHESIRFWRGRSGSGPRRPTVESWVTNAREPVALYGLVDKAGGWAAGTVPDAWLVDVWARGLAVVDGSFVLAVTDWEEYPERLRVQAARWERRLGDGSTPVIEAAVVVPRDGDGGWALRWL